METCRMCSQPIRMMSRTEAFTANRPRTWIHAGTGEHHADRPFPHRAEPVRVAGANVAQVNCLGCAASVAIGSAARTHGYCERCAESRAA